MNIWKFKPVISLVSVCDLRSSSLWSPGFLRSAKIRAFGLNQGDHMLKPSKGPKTKKKEGKKRAPQNVQAYDLPTPPILQKEAFWQ